MLGLVLLPACTTARPAGPAAVEIATATPPPPPAATATATLPARPPSSPSVTPTPPVVARTGLRLPPAVHEVAKGFGGPDDLALSGDGFILFSDTGNGTVNQVHPNGSVMTLVRGLEEPEGIVVLPDGSLLIAEQKKNRLVRFAGGGRLTTWLELENKTGKAGVDGIARDPQSGEIIVPDSPNGRVLRVSPDGKSVRVVVTGLVRPTGAAVERDGSILIVDEYGNTVQRLRRDGKLEALGHFATPDDVAVDDRGDIFVASLGDDSVRLIDPQKGSTVLIANVRGPQGILLDRDGNLLVTEFALNRILRLQIR